MRSSILRAAAAAAITTVVLVQTAASEPFDPERDHRPAAYRPGWHAATVEACTPDYRRFCGGVIPGGGRVVACLAGNRDRISSACGRALSYVAPYLFGGHRRWRGDTYDEPDPGPDAYEPPDLSDAPLK